MRTLSLNLVGASTTVPWTLSVPAHSATLVLTRSIIIQLSSRESLIND